MRQHGRAGLRKNPKSLAAASRSGWKPARSRSQRRIFDPAAIRDPWAGADLHPRGGIVRRCMNSHRSSCSTAGGRPVCRRAANRFGSGLEVDRGMQLRRARRQNTDGSLPLRTGRRKPRLLRLLSTASIKRRYRDRGLDRADQEPSSGKGDGQVQAPSTQELALDAFRVA
jgi:hypothetical protein